MQMGSWEREGEKSEGVRKEEEATRLGREKLRRWQSVGKYRPKDVHVAFLPPSHHSMEA